MSDEENAGEAYVRKVHGETRQFTKDLLTENERLRDQIASLQRDLSRTQSELDAFRKDETTLKREMSQIEEANRHFTQKFVEVEEQNSNLANLYVASYRLSATLDRQEVISTIQEIIINLIGSEEFAIFELDSHRPTLSLVGSFGVEPERYRSFPTDVGRIGRAVQTGELYLREGSHPEVSPEVMPDGPPDSLMEEHLTACIPLKVDGKVLGVIAIFRLLQQKQGLVNVDYELIDLLATHAAMALYCTHLHFRLTSDVGKDG